MRQKFLDNQFDKQRYIEPELLELIKSYSDDDAWLIMRSLYVAHSKLQGALNGMEWTQTGWLDNYD